MGRNGASSRRHRVVELREGGLQMNRRNIFAASAIAVVAVAMVAGGVTAQQEKGKGKGGGEGKGPPQAQAPQPPKPWKEEIVGSWALLIVDGIKADGTKVPLYGPNPKGIDVRARGQ